MDSQRVFIGIDAGGTRSRLKGACLPDVLSIDREGPGANPQRVGFDASATILVGLVNEALAAARDARLAGLCLGVAGIGRDADRERLAHALREGLGSRAPTRLVVMSDADLALTSAHGETGSGLLLIAGTGSIVLGRTRGGERVRAGGWGFLLGDEGGGYRIGLAGLQAVARAYDGGPPTMLTDSLRATFGIDGPAHLIETAYSPGWSPAAIAPLVLTAADAGDAISCHILLEQTETLAGQVGRLVALTPDLDPTLCLSGGLTKHSGYTATLTSALHRILPDLDIAPLAIPPVEAALAIAHAA